MMKKPKAVCLIGLTHSEEGARVCASIGKNYKKALENLDEIYESSHPFFCIDLEDDRKQNAHAPKLIRAMLEMDKHLGIDSGMALEEWIADVWKETVRQHLAGESFAPDLESNDMHYLEAAKIIRSTYASYDIVRIANALGGLEFASINQFEACSFDFGMHSLIRCIRKNVETNSEMLKLKRWFE